MFGGDGERKEGPDPAPACESLGDTALRPLYLLIDGSLVPKFQGTLNFSQLIAAERLRLSTASAIDYGNLAQSRVEHAQMQRMGHDVDRRLPTAEEILF